jgi:hypothetical protein
MKQGEKRRRKIKLRNQTQRNNMKKNKQRLEKKHEKKRRLNLKPKLMRM